MFVTALDYKGLVREYLIARRVREWFVVGLAFGCSGMVRIGYAVIGEEDFSVDEMS